jgi:hypothetical protein
MTFADLVTGKSIALIAPGAYLAGTKQREKIDGFDLVARINRGFPVPLAMVEDIGERCDILFHLLSVGMAANEKEFAPLVGHVGFIVSTHHQGEPRFARFKAINRGRIPCECVPFSVVQRVRLHVRKAPNAGVVAITHLLSLPIKSLYLTGFSFYEDGYYAGYNPKVPNIKGGQAGHDQTSAKAYLKELIASSAIPVEIDAVMQHVFDRTLAVQKQLEELQRIGNDKVVELKATVTQRHGAETIVAGDTMLRIKRDADILIRKRRAVLV